MKKILLLGGSAQQVIAIETAKRKGIYTILCDYLTDNPGQYVADKFYLVSSTDKEAVLKVAQEEKIDGILAYASDPAALTAAYVAEKLNLPGNPYRSIEILCNKDLYREFLKEHGFFTPEAGGYTSTAAAVEDCRNGKYQFPVIAKPVDSSGSKGVVKIARMEDLVESLRYSMSFSRAGKIIIEEFVEKLGYQIAGDGLSIDGNLEFWSFANDHFNEKSDNPFVPISASFPYNMPGWVHDKVQQEIQRLISLLGMKTCMYNFDIRIDSDYNVYLMEIAPRNGGNYIPQVIQYANRIDLVEYAVNAAIGMPIETPEREKTDGFWSYYAVNSQQEGVLESIDISEEVLSTNIVENHLIKSPGDEVEAFTGANTTLGCLIMRFDSMEEMLDMMDHSEKWIHVNLKPE